MKKLFVSLLSLFALLSINVHADISHNKFMTSFAPQFSKLGCADNGVLRRCFRVKQNICLASTAAAAETCKVEMRQDMPARIKGQAQSAYWGGRLASCISRRFSIKHISAVNKADQNCSGLTTTR